MRSPISRARGFSLVELLISVAIGLLALGFATRVVFSSESAKSSAVATSDSMQNGMLAMFSISGDAQQAGFGLNDPLVTGCNTFFRDNQGFELVETELIDATGAKHMVRPLAPAIIESGGTGPDRITLYSGASRGGTGTVRVVDYDRGLQNTLELGGQAFGFDRGDVVVIASETAGKDCELTQVSEEPPADPVLSVGKADVDFRYNNGALSTEILPGQTRVFNLGRAASLSFHTWSVANGFLQLRATDMPGAGENPATVADDIVSIKAQYGFDTRATAAFVERETLAVGRWSATMVDADGDGVRGGRGDYQRIAALRIAVVARSKKRERQVGGCTATTVKPTVFATEVPVGVVAVPVQVDVAVAGDKTEWQCYRYRVFETVVPLRNSQWSPSNATAL